MKAVSGERALAELLASVAADRPATSVRSLDELGLLGQVLPELAACRGIRQSPPHQWDVFEHSLAVVDALAQMEYYLAGGKSVAAAPWAGVLLPFRDQLATALLGTEMSGQPRMVWLRLAGLLHDVGKPDTQQIGADGLIRFPGHAELGADLVRQAASRLGCDEGLTSYLANVVRNHRRPLAMARSGEVTAAAANSYYRDTGPAGVDVTVLSLADGAAKLPGDAAKEAIRMAAVRQLLAAWFDQGAGVASGECP